MQSAGTRRIVRNTALLAAAQTIGTVARLAYVVVVARLLGPELYALLAYVQSWHLAFLPIALAGLGPALVHWISAEPGRTGGFVASGLALRAATTAVAAAACLALAAMFAPDPRAPALIAVLLLALAGRAMTAWAQHLYIALDLNRHTLRQESAFRLLELAAAATALLGGFGLQGLVIAQAAVWCVQAAVALRVAAAHVGPLRFGWPRREARDLVAFAMPFFGLQLLAEWRIHGPLILFRNVTDDAALFAQFALAMQAMLIASALPQALGAAAQPGLSRSAARRDARDIDYASMLQRLAFVGGTAAGLCGLALGPAVFAALFGADFAPAGHLAGLTLWCLIPVTAGFAFPLVLMLRGEAGNQILQSIAATLVMAALVPLLGAQFGPQGAIAGAGLGFATPPIVSTVIALRRGWGRLGSLLGRPAAMAGIALAAYLALEPLSAALGLSAGLAGLAIMARSLGVLTGADVELLRSVRRTAAASNTARPLP
jgi:O-antigen/teichoic acid export membrane protein